MKLSKKNISGYCVGQLCYSKQGRDKDKVYIVYEIVDEDYILVVNGDDRKISNPKKKNKKHLQKMNHIIEDFDKMKSEGEINDLIVKRYIKEKTQEENLIDVK